MKLLLYLQLTKQVSRRDFTDMIKEQVIFLNDQLVESFEATISIGDTLRISLGPKDEYIEEITKLPVARPKLLLFHKPAGYVVSKDDPHNKTIYKLLPEKYHKRYYIGRLDKESTGLLLLTNDPGLVDWYENPQSNIKKVYEVMIDKPFKSQHTKKACKGIIVTDEGKIANEKKNETGELLRCQQISYFRNDRGQYFVSIVLTEGKNRQIRRMLSALGYKVKSLHRTRIGQHLLGAIKSGKWSQIEVKPEKGKKR